uniref:Secreted protein n=1 Tax=Anopheles epiroticus TaxID=199890 RepID=A0A182NZV2_9DIPT
MFRLCRVLVGVLLPVAIIAAPTVHLQNHLPESGTADAYGGGQSVTETPQFQTRPHVVEPTWITVTVPPESYNPSRTVNPQYHAMPQYVTYMPFPPVHQQPMMGQWPSYYPSMPVMPYQYPSNHLCNQPTGSYRVT